MEITKHKGKRGEERGRHRDAVGHLFEHKYLCQRSQCRGTNYVESAQPCSSEESRGKRQREQTEISQAPIQVLSSNLPFLYRNCRKRHFLPLLKALFGW